MGNRKELGLRLWPRHKYLNWQTCVHSKAVFWSLWRRISDVLSTQDGGKKRVLLKNRIPSAHAWRIWNATWPICHTFRAPPPFAFKSHSLPWFAAVKNYRSHLLHLQKNTIWNKNVGGSILTLFWGESIACAGHSHSQVTHFVLHTCLTLFLSILGLRREKEGIITSKKWKPSFSQPSKRPYLPFFSRDHWYARAQYQHSAWERKRSF